MTPKAIKSILSWPLTLLMRKFIADWSIAEYAKTQGQVLIFVPPSVEGVCDNCGGELYQRGSDTAEKVQPRIDGYHEWTLPMLSYLENHGFTVVHIDGMKKPSEVSNDISKTLTNQGFAE